jgi:endonuclease YncB( thermonuclease family)
LLGEMRIGFLCSTAILILALFNITMCAPDESYGVVSKIIDGSTFNMVVEKADPKIFYNTERVTLADIKCPDLNTSDGLAARDLTAAVLLNRRVFLDINNLGNGRDSQRRLVCVVYLSGYYGQPLLSPCYNRILVDSGLATVNDSKDNEFNPADWWSRASSTGPGYNDSTQAINRLESAARDILGPVQGELGKEYDKRSKEAVDWLRKQLPIK